MQRCESYPRSVCVNQESLQGESSSTIGRECYGQDQRGPWLVVTQNLAPFVHERCMPNGGVLSCAELPLATTANPGVRSRVEVNGRSGAAIINDFPALKHHAKRRETPH